MLLPNSDDLTCINQIRILDARVESQKIVNGRPILVGNDLERIAFLDDVGRDARRDRDCLPNIDHIGVGDLGIKLEDHIYSRAQFISNLAQGVALFDIVGLTSGRRRRCSSRYLSTLRTSWSA